MIPKDLTEDIINRVRSIRGQLEGIQKMLDNGKDPEQIINQFKAAEKAVQKAQFLLLDEVYRKALAITIVEAVNACPGNCGNEEKIEFIKNQFPDIELKDLPGKINEMTKIKDNIIRFNAMESSKKKKS